MMQVGFWELMVVFAVALLVIGPDKLPDYARKLGQALRSFRAASSELTQDIREAVVEPLEEAQRPLQEALQPINDLTREVNADLAGLQKSVRDLGKPPKTPAQPAPKAAPEPPSDPAPAAAAPAQPETPAPAPETAAPAAAPSPAPAPADAENQ